MTSKHPKNIAASVRQRLLNLATMEQRSFEEIARLYAMERFLYRLSQSQHSNKFILKGALKPIADSIRENNAIKGIWKAGGLWRLS